MMQVIPIKTLSCLVVIGILASIAPIFAPEASAALRPYRYMGTIISEDIQSKSFTIQMDYQYYAEYYGLSGAEGTWMPCNITLTGTAPNNDSLKGLKVGDYVETYSFGGGWVTLAKIKKSDTGEYVTDIYGDPAGICSWSGEYDPPLIGGYAIEYANTPDCHNCLGCNCKAKYTTIIIHSEPSGYPVEGHQLYPGQDWICTPDIYTIDITFNSGQAPIYLCGHQLCGGPQAVSNFTIHISLRLRNTIVFTIYPNPATTLPITFTVQSLTEEPLSAVKVQIYDPSGNLVYSSTETPGIAINWWAKDNYGEYVANGVYLYIMYAKVNGEWVRSKIKKLVILR